MNDEISSWLKRSSATMDLSVGAHSGLFDRLRFVSDLIRSARSLPNEPVLLRRDKFEVIQVTTIRSGIVVGREAPSDLVLDDTRLSRQHFSIKAHAHAFILNDLNSRNGTWVNGKRIKELPLKDGDIIEAGGSVWAFLLSPENPKSSCH